VTLVRKTLEFISEICLESRIETISKSQNVKDTILGSNCRFVRPKNYLESELEARYSGYRYDALRLMHSTLLARDMVLGGNIACLQEICEFDQQYHTQTKDRYMVGQTMS
jgi:hypothetical protein